MTKKNLSISKSVARAKRAKKLVDYLKKTYPKPKSELKYNTPFQFVVAVMFSAQCTDKAVNKLTNSLWKKYKTPQDFAQVSISSFTKEISCIPFFRNKARAVTHTAKIICAQYDGNIPKTESELLMLPGIGYKTAQVILGELYDTWEGIATDTHVKRFAKRFDLTDNTDLTKISKDLEALIQKKDWKYVNNGFILYGRYVCPARRHDCALHPLTRLYPPAGSRWFVASRRSGGTLDKSGR